MKFSTAISISISGLASASAIHARDGHHQVEQPAQEHPAPVEEYPVEEYPAEEHPVEEYPAPPAEEHPVEEYPAEEHPAPPAEEHPVEEYPAPVEEIYPPMEHEGIEELPHGMKGWGLNENMENHVIMVWMNPGAGEENHAINDQVTVTETVTVGGHYTPPPEAVHPPPAEHPVEEAPEHPPPEHPDQTVPDEHTEVVPGTGETHHVVVGGEDLIYHPEELKANVGDMVIFEFMNENHTATQSSFDEPCMPLPGGMDSGFVPNPDDTIDPAPQVAMQIMTSDPLWFYCAQGPHCAKGMVFSINPTEERTHAMFKDIAGQSGEGEDSDIVDGEEGDDVEDEEPAEDEEVVEQPPPVEEGDDEVEQPAEDEEVVEPPAEDEEVVEQPAPDGGHVVDGVGEIGEGGACYCHVQCDMGSYPNLESQGVGAVGGMGGSIPMDAEQPALRKW